MKKHYPIILIALLITTLAACKKDKGSNDDPKKDLVSIWELTEVSSAMLPVKTYDKGNGNLLIINDDNTYAYYSNGQVTQQGNYSIVADSSVEKEVCLINLKDKYKNRFEVTNVTPIPLVPVFKTFFNVENDKLYLIGGCYALDAGSLRVYRRANEIPHY